MYLDKYLDYLSFEKKYSINTLESYKNDVEPMTQTLPGFEDPSKKKAPFKFCVT